MEKLIKENNVNIKFKTIIDILVCISLIVLSIKKGGFYKEDLLAVSLTIVIIAIVFLFYNIIFNKFKDIKRVNIIDWLLIILAASYFFPIIFKNYTNLNDAIFEACRYSLLFIVYFLVKNSSNKKIYEYLIIIIATIQSLFGIDQLFFKVFENLLDYFNSGYLQKDFDRLSSTIQYANVTAILIFVGIFFIIKFIEDNTKNETKFKRVKISLLNNILILNIAALILTKSRMVIAILILMFILKIIIDKENKLLNINNIIYFIFSFIVISFINNLEKTYFNIIALFIILFTFSFLLNVLTTYINLKGYKINNKKIFIFLALFITLYVILALNIKTNLKITYKEDTNNITSVYIYDLKSGINAVKIVTSNKDKDTSYDIKVYEVLSDSTSNVIYTINSYSSNTGQYIFEYDLKNDNFKNLKFDFIINKGSFSLDNIQINEEVKNVNYLLIPNDFIFKIQDVIYGSSSINDRIEYNKDALLIITNNFKNFFFGVGGEGFKYLYENYQRIPYYSTEVHNSYLQIFLESGIFSFLAIILIVALSLKKYSKINKNIYIAFLGLCIHMLVDLEFSYFIIILLFSIFLGIMEEDINANNKYRIEKYIYLVVLIFDLVFNFTTLTFANISYYKYKNINSMKSSDIYQNISDISTLEKIVSLDFTNINYRKKLNAEYFNYVKNLENKLKTTNIEEQVKLNIEYEIRDTIKLIKENTDKIYNYDCYNKNTIKYVNDVYFEYLEYFVDVYNEKDKYIEFMKNNIEYIRNTVNLDVKKQNYLENMEKDIKMLQNSL